MQHQKRFLLHLINRHGETEFGREHFFSEIRSLEDYRNRVPIRTWKTYAPYVEAVINGNRAMLFDDQTKLEMLALSSGSTGNPKLIPVTRDSYQAYARYWPHTWLNLFRESPAVLEGKCLYMPGDAKKGEIGNIPYGAISARAYSQQSWFARRLYAYPAEVSRIEDFEHFCYTLLRLALEHPITMMVVPNPSSLIYLFELGRREAPRLIEEIAKGTLQDHDSVPSELREQLRSSLSPNPRRAEALDEILEKTGDFLPRDYWPARLTGIACLASGTFERHLRRLGDYLGPRVVGDLGLLASEGRLSFPLAPVEEEQGCCLAFESYFFEFIPAEKLEENSPPALTLDQLEVGKKYSVVLTTGGGLYRYHIEDLVQVTGFFERVPLVRFLGKTQNYMNAIGEKISDFQLSRAISESSAESDLEIDDFVATVEWRDHIPSYRILIVRSSQGEVERIQRFGDRVDERLMRFNVEYRNRRKAKRLGPPSIRCVSASDFQRYRKKQRDRSGHFVQYKESVFSSKTEELLRQQNPGAEVQAGGIQEEN